MSEYWISQGRRMCTYCKCWTADNKASIQFHENGKNHKENVKRKLDELRKKGHDDYKKKEQEKNQLAAIEKAALKSLKKDLASNPSLASAYGISGDKITSAQHVLEKKLQSDKHTSVNSDVPGTRDGSASKAKGSEEDQSQSQGQHYQGDWYSAVTDEGYTYYWNSVTGETTWNPPDHEDGKEVPSTSKNNTQMGGSSAYGAWQLIQEEQLPDLQLPNDSNNFEVCADEIPLPNYAEPAAEHDKEQEPPEKKFKEKTISLSNDNKSGNSSHPVTFKKRKIGAGRQNRRQTPDDS